MRQFGFDETGRIVPATLGTDRTAVPVDSRVAQVGVTAVGPVGTIEHLPVDESQIQAQRLVVTDDRSDVADAPVVLEGRRHQAVAVHVQAVGTGHWADLVAGTDRFAFHSEDDVDGVAQWLAVCVILDDGRLAAFQLFGERAAPLSVHVWLRRRRRRTQRAVVGSRGRGSVARRRHRVVVRALSVIPVVEVAVRGRLAEQAGQDRVVVAHDSHDRRWRRQVSVVHVLIRIGVGRVGVDFVQRRRHQGRRAFVDLHVALQVGLVRCGVVAQVAGELFEARVHRVVAAQQRPPAEAAAANAANVSVAVVRRRVVAQRRLVGEARAAALEHGRALFVHRRRVPLQVVAPVRPVRAQRARKQPLLRRHNTTGVVAAVTLLLQVHLQQLRCRHFCTRQFKQVLVLQQLETKIRIIPRATFQAA